jgi:hypothetical protein
MCQAVTFRELWTAEAELTCPAAAGQLTGDTANCCGTGLRPVNNILVAEDTAISQTTYGVLANEIPIFY